MLNTLNGYHYYSINTDPISQIVHVVSPLSEKNPLVHGVGTIVAFRQVLPPGHVRQSNCRLAGVPERNDYMSMSCQVTKKVEN
jgi:hypothetical protein